MMIVVVKVDVVEVLVVVVEIDLIDDHIHFGMYYRLDSDHRS